MEMNLVTIAIQELLICQEVCAHVHMHVRNPKVWVQSSNCTLYALAALKLATSLRGKKRSATAWHSWPLMHLQHSKKLRLSSGPPLSLWCVLPPIWSIGFGIKTLWVFLLWSIFNVQSCFAGFLLTSKVQMRKGWMWIWRRQCWLVSYLQMGHSACQHL